MGIIHEETQHTDFGLEIMVTERTKGECREAWKMITLDIDHFQSFTPVELRKLGRALINEGKRIGKQYKSNGAPKEAV